MKLNGEARRWHYFIMVTVRGLIEAARYSERYSVEDPRGMKLYFLARAIEKLDLARSIREDGI